MRHRLERALRQRVRYRYVKPRVLREGDGLRIESPCCSRNVDAQGGVIDIALLLPVGGDEHQGSGQAAQLWRLFARDHAAGGWVLQHESERIDDLVQLLCTDARRVYWP
ncbi:MAG: hypothetical protein LBP52_09390 [Burkholderiaceae bacterium]|nr:hypothetical protein [Burkholderiaceae bacterium]